jgi:hypothetical protein
VLVSTRKKVVLFGEGNEGPSEEMKDGRSSGGDMIGSGMTDSSVPARKQWQNQPIQRPSRVEMRVWKSAELEIGFCGVVDVNHQPGSGTWDPVDAVRVPRPRLEHGACGPGCGPCRTLALEGVHGSWGITSHIPAHPTCLIGHCSHFSHVPLSLRRFHVWLR